jgi:hypothetical protein
MIGVVQNPQFSIVFDVGPSFDPPDVSTQADFIDQSSTTRSRVMGLAVGVRTGDEP